MNWRDITERAGWTFVQGALATVGAVPLVTDVDGWESITVAAVTGGVASLISFIKTVSQEKLAIPDTRAK